MQPGPSDGGGGVGAGRRLAVVRASKGVRIESLDPWFAP
ncbi:hypothetical protein FHS32_002554 [Streptomyces albaduncus]|uniref:Uncharacterized protein n=1 Tax=Streptomyces griseoloalbus TaxID=67303 RepID=A0A7W8BM47_9ACTN|nr:hypothetical protein [Streptomyces albaduncus]